MEFISRDPAKQARQRMLLAHSGESKSSGKYCWFLSYGQDNLPSRRVVWFYKGKRASLSSKPNADNSSVVVSLVLTAAHAKKVSQLILKRLWWSAEVITLFRYIAYSFPSFWWEFLRKMGNCISRFKCSYDVTIHPWLLRNKWKPIANWRQEWIFLLAIIPLIWTNYARRHIHLPVGISAALHGVQIWMHGYLGLSELFSRRRILNSSLQDIFLIYLEKTVIVWHPDYEKCSISWMLRKTYRGDWNWKSLSFGKIGH